MEAIHLAQSAIITQQREEIEELKKTLETYRNKYYDNHDTILKLKTRIYYLGEMLEHYTERKNYGKN